MSKSSNANTPREKGVRSALAVAKQSLSKHSPLVGRIALAAMAAASVLGTMSCVPSWGPPAPPAADPFQILDAELGW